MIPDLIIGSIAGVLYINGAKGASGAQGLKCPIAAKSFLP